jgi:hypothetical protein
MHINAHYGCPLKYITKLHLMTHLFSHAIGFVNPQLSSILHHELLCKTLIISMAKA